jgi:hypothetical protein
MSRGDTLQLAIQVLQDNGAPQNLTGFTVWFTAKYTVYDADLRSVFALDNISPGGNGGVVLTFPTIGEFTVTGPAVATQGFPDGVVTLVYDVQVEDASGNLTTVETGTLAVNPDVTRSISGPA